MSATTPTPTLSVDIAALIARCQVTHEADLTLIEQRAKRLGEACVRRVAFGGIKRDEFADAVAFSGVLMPDEAPDQYAARQRGFVAGLIEGIAAVAAR